jgi:hypothetical protein
LVVKKRSDRESASSIEYEAVDGLSALRIIERGLLGAESHGRAMPCRSSAPIIRLNASL